jgi:phosphoribulokinase
MATVICLDDYHSLDRKGRAEKGVTALAPEAQNFDLMAQQVAALKAGNPVDKPIYNHVTGALDAPEKIDSPEVGGGKGGGGGREGGVRAQPECSRTAT